MDDKKYQELLSHLQNLTPQNEEYEKIICRFGAPRVIQSDRGTHFINEVIWKLTKRFRVRHSLSSPYHPQSNGLVKRFNKTLCEGIAKVAEELGSWDQYIQPILFVYR